MSFFHFGTPVFGQLDQLGPQPEIIRSGISRELEPLPGPEHGDELRDWDDGLLDCIGENLVQYWVYWGRLLFVVERRGPSKYVQPGK